MYISEEEVSVAFEDANFDFDLIDRALNVLTNVDNKVLYTRSLVGTGKEVFDGLKAINTMIEVQDKSILSTNLNKQLIKFNEDILEAQLVLVNKNVATPITKKKKTI